MRIIKRSLYLGCMMMGLFLPLSSFAQSCLYDLHSLSHISSFVSRITERGVLLQNGRSVILSDRLLPFIVLHKNFTFYGLNSLKGEGFWALALSEEGEHKQIFCTNGEEFKKGSYPGSKDYDVIQEEKNSPDTKNSEPSL